MLRKKKISAPSHRQDSLRCTPAREQMQTLKRKTRCMSTGNKNQSIPSAELKLLLFMEVDSMSQMNEKYVSRN